MTTTGRAARHDTDDERVSRRTLLKGGLAASVPRARPASPACRRRPAPPSTGRWQWRRRVDPADAERHPSRGHPHAGEPLVRPLLRHAVGRARLLGPEGRHQPGRWPSACRSGTSTATSPASASTRRATWSRSTSSSSSRPEDGDSTNDIIHEWTTQHQSWDGGTMDAFVQAHLAADGDANFVATMGYFTGPTSPSITRWPTPSPSATPTTARCSGPPTPTASWRCRAPSTPPARGGGPVLVTQTSGRPQQYGTFEWTTMPEQLLDAGVTWKVYNDPTGLALFSPLPYFKAYNDPRRPGACSCSTRPSRPTIRRTSSPTWRPGRCRR